MNIKKIALNLVVIAVTLGLMFIAFLMIELMESGDISGWIGHPVGWFCIISSLITAQLIED